MPPKMTIETDLNRIRHMLDATTEAVFFIRGKKQNDLGQDRKLALALIKELEIIGEAASRVSKNFQEANPEIPWTAIIATRNRLIHGYFDIDLAVVWTTIVKHLKPLKKSLVKILDQK